MALFCEYCGSKIGFFAMEYYIDGKVICSKCKEGAERKENEVAASVTENQTVKNESTESNITSYTSFYDYINSMKKDREYIEERLEKISIPVSPNHDVDNESKALYVTSYALWKEAENYFGLNDMVILKEQSFEKLAYSYIHRGKDILELRENINLHYDEKEYDKVAWDLQVYLGQHYDNPLVLLQIATKAALWGDKMLACAALRLLNGLCISVIDGRRY